MPIKNNVTRMLDAKKIKYTAHALPEEKLGAVEAAAHLGVEPYLVYKTIVSVRTTRESRSWQLCRATKNSTSNYWRRPSKKRRSNLPAILKLKL